MEVLNDVLNYKDLKIIQDNRMFNFCIDSVLLSRFYTPNKNEKIILDIGTNNAIIPLIISKYTNEKIVGVEIQSQAVEIANKNIKMNNLENQIQIVNEDIKEFIKNKNNMFDLIYCNPPFFKVHEESKFNKKSELLISARHEINLNLDELIRCARIGLKNKGKLVLIHLAERIDEIIFSLKQNGLSPKRIKFIHSKRRQNAKKVLIMAVNYGNEGCFIEEPLYVHNEDGSYTKEVSEIFEE